MPLVFNPILMSQAGFRRMSDPFGTLTRDSHMIIVRCDEVHVEKEFCPGWKWERKDALPPPDWRQIALDLYHSNERWGLTRQRTDAEVALHTALELEGKPLARPDGA